jgi:hypothetical protein
MHIENLLFILLIAIAVLFRLLASKVGEAKKGSQDPDQRSTTGPRPVEPIRRAPVESDAERIRRFLEALGQPADTRPPPPVAPRTDIPPRPLAPVQPPGPIPTVRNVLTRRKRQIVEAPQSPAPPVFEPREAPPSPAEVPASIEPPLEKYAVAAESKTKVAPTGTDIATLLRSSTGQRNAIILREILGSPRGVQRLELFNDLTI